MQVAVLVQRLGARCSCSLFTAFVPVLFKKTASVKAVLCRRLFWRSAEECVCDVACDEK